MRRLKAFVTRQKVDLKEGLVKYNNFIFWWKKDSNGYGSGFKRYWRFKKAYNEGVLDFYMSTLLLVGGFTVIYGVYRGYKKKGNHSYYENINKLKMIELDLEMERIKLLMEI